jgi:hypothetical protein
MVQNLATAVGKQVTIAQRRDCHPERSAERMRRTKSKDLDFDEEFLADHNGAIVILVSPSPERSRRGSEGSP